VPKWVSREIAEKTNSTNIQWVMLRTACERYPVLFFISLLKKINKNKGRMRSGKPRNDHAGAGNPIIKNELIIKIEESRIGKAIVTSSMNIRTGTIAILTPSLVPSATTCTKVNISPKINRATFIIYLFEKKLAKTTPFQITHSGVFSFKVKLRNKP
jgi:hypothetical protein